MNRIKHIVQQIPLGIDNLYDLFCDHGKVGHSYSKLSANTHVTFIDNKKHIVDKIDKTFGNKKKFSFITEDARHSKFKKGSTIVMCGTGANLVMDCLDHYQKQSDFSSFHFVFAVNMHHFELRHYLIENSLFCEHKETITDGHYCYEIIQTNLDEQKLSIFNEREWDLSNPIQKHHLSCKLKTYQVKKDLLPWEKELSRQLQHFLS